MNSKKYSIISLNYSPPPIPAGSGMQTYGGIPPINDCCCRCAVPCQFMGRAKTHGAKIFTVPNEEFSDDATCNSEKLRRIIEEVQFLDKNRLFSLTKSVFRTLLKTQQHQKVLKLNYHVYEFYSIILGAIQAAAEKKLFSKFNVRFELFIKYK